MIFQKTAAKVRLRKYEDTISVLAGQFVNSPTPHFLRIYSEQLVHNIGLALELQKEVGVKQRVKVSSVKAKTLEPDAPIDLHLKQAGEEIPKRIREIIREDNYYVLRENAERILVLLRNTDGRLPY